MEPGSMLRTSTPGCTEPSTDIFERYHRCYGYHRLQAPLARQRASISEKVVQRLIKQKSLVVAKPKRRRYGSYLGEISPAPDNLLNRDFRAAAPNEKWLTDITEFPIPAGNVYLSPMINCFDGMLVSWSLGTRPDAELVNTMLDAAIETVVDTEDRPVVHSDRGAHYRWPGWLSRIANAKLIRSMPRKGYSPDNAACEGFFGRLKNRAVLSSQLAVRNHRAVHPSRGRLHPLVQRTADQDLPGLSQPHRIPRGSWTYGIKPVQVSIRTPLHQGRTKQRD
jgi:transposase InsO family protein